MKVSVCMITYGHEDYVINSIESILNQKVNFPIELIISNDASPDNSDHIIREYLQNHPKKEMVRYILREKNLGVQRNYFQTLKESKGEYIAVCEGDDYWIDQNKLQKQIDFLDQNPDYFIHCHNMKILEGTILQEKSYLDSTKIPDTLDINDLAKRNYIATLTSVFRNQLPETLPDEFYHLAMADYPLFMYILKDKKIRYSNEKMAVYRVGEGVWSSVTNVSRNKKLLEVYYFLLESANLSSEVKSNLKIAVGNVIKLILLNEKNDLSKEGDQDFYKKLSLKDKIIVGLKRLRK